MESLKIVLADDHSVIQEGVRFVFRSDTRFQVVESFSDGFSLLEFLKTVSVDLVLLDIDMPGAKGFSVLKSIKEINALTKVIIFSVHNGSEYFFEALKNGADGFVLKTELVTFLPTILIQINRGEFYCSDELKPFLENKKIKKRKPLENSILHFLSKGFQYKAIANKIGKTEHTVEYYIYKLRKRFGVENNSELLSKLKGDLFIEEE